MVCELASGEMLKRGSRPLMNQWRLVTADVAREFIEYSETGRYIIVVALRLKGRLLKSLKSLLQP